MRPHADWVPRSLPMSEDVRDVRVHRLRSPPTRPSAPCRTRARPRAVRWQLLLGCECDLLLPKFRCAVARESHASPSASVRPASASVPVTASLFRRGGEACDRGSDARSISVRGTSALTSARSAGSHASAVAKSGSGRAARSGAAAGTCTGSAARAGSGRGPRASPIRLAARMCPSSRSTPLCFLLEQVSKKVASRRGVTRPKV